MQASSPLVRRQLRLLIADDHRVLLESLETRLRTQGFSVIGTAENGRRAVRLARKLRPDVVLLDVAMPVMNGLDAARLILHALPETAILLLAEKAEDHLVLQGLRIGARGFVVKAQGIDDLISAIRIVNDGAIYVSASNSHVMLQAFGDREARARTDLTPREVQVLRLIAQGRSTKEAAACLDISVRTAESHRAHLMRKLSIHDVPGLVRYAIRRGMIVA